MKFDDSNTAIKAAERAHFTEMRDKTISAPDVMIRMRDHGCSHHPSDDCDCSDHPDIAVIVDGLGGYGGGEWTLNPDTRREQLSMRTYWGSFDVESVDQAAAELQRRLAPVNPEIKVSVLSL